jgi:hypothetical protein
MRDGCLCFIFQFMYSLRLRLGSEDKLCWALPREGCSTLDLSTVFLSLMMALSSLEIVFGGLRSF